MIDDGTGVFGGDETLATWDVRVRADTSDFEDKMRSVGRAGSQFSGALINAFEGVAIKGKSLGDVFKSLAMQLSSIVLKAAFKPLEQGFSNILSGALSGGMFAFAKGGVISQGTPVPFANGGVIASPISFPLAGGMRGIAGERGAEAIMPLSRGADGRLGVAMSGGGCGAPITINIQASDVESFRRSETQVAAMIARAASLGRRNL
jgi:phage-related minor tail protein